MTRTIIFKALESCNANCAYCKVIHKDTGQRMKLELLRTVMERLREFLLEYTEDTVVFTWHGGEACLLGAAYFETALELSQSILGDLAKRVKHQMQSNLTLLNPEILDVLKRLGIKDLGTSFDPLPGVRGFGKDRDTLAYNTAFFKGAALLEQENMGWGAIYVVHKASLSNPLGIFRHLYNLNPRRMASFNRIYLYDGSETDLGVSPEEFADFLGAILPEYLKHPKRYGHVRPISMFIHALESKGGLVCDYSGICAEGWLYLGPEGNASHCGRGGDYDLVSYGNIRTDTMKTLFTHAMRTRIAARGAILQEGECKDCAYWKICHGGCPMDTLALSGTIEARSENCRFIKRFIGTYLEPSLAQGNGFGASQTLNLDQ